MNVNVIKLFNVLGEAVHLYRSRQSDTVQQPMSDS